MSTHPPTPLSDSTCAVLRAVIAYKQAHDGNAPAVDDLMTAVSLAKSTVWYHVQVLLANGLLQRVPGNSRNLAVVGGRWEWAAPRPYPPGRLGDVLRCIVAHKRAHDGTAPGHRDIAVCLQVVYTGGIREYLDALVEADYITTPYTMDRHIIVHGGAWHHTPPPQLAALCPDPRPGQLAIPL